MKFKLTFLGILCFVFFQANDFFKFLESPKKETASSLLIFYRPDCPYCYKLDQEISVNQKLAALIKSDYNVTAIDISTPEGKNIADYYQVHSVPMLIKYDKKNQSENLLGFHKTEIIEKFLTNQKFTTKSTKSAVCGDGIIETGEQCDDGNLNNGDGCTNSCTIQSGYTCSGTPSICTPSAVCGNGIVEPGEVCDDGNSVNNDRCDNTCTRIAACGNGYVETGEQCDDGNSVNGDGCDNTCTLTAVCGNGIVEPGETCDDGNLVNGDGCNNTCTPSVLSVGEVENTGVLNLKIGYDSAFSNNIKVQFFLAKKTKLEIEILDLSGRKLLKRSYNQLIVGLNNIDVEFSSKIMSGIYLINLKFENENNVSIVSKKIIVK